MEVDDMNSMIHLSLYLNELDVLGVIYTSSQFHFNGDGKGTTLEQVTPHYRTSGLAGLARPKKTRGPDPEGGKLMEFRPFPMGWIENLWKNSYAKAYPYLIKHDKSYPSPEYMLSITKYGNIEFEGDVRFDTDGSNLIKEYLLDDSMEPIYLQSWGGINTIVRALLSIYECYHDTEKWNDIYQKVCSKAKILGMFDGLIGQDNSWLDNRIPEIYPDIELLYPEYGYGAYFASIGSQKDMRDCFKSKWMKENIVNGTSALADEYHLMMDGRRIPGEAEIYQFGLTNKIDFGFPGLEDIVFDQYDFIGEGDSNTYIPLISFGLRGLENYTYGTLLGRLFTDEKDKPKGGNPFTGEGIRINPYIKAYHEDWAARIEWCYKEFDEANHAPVIEVEAKDIYVEKGLNVDLNTTIIEPDGDDYGCMWTCSYTTYQGKENLFIWEPWKECTTISIPEDARKDDYFVCTLRVQDCTIKPMTSFAQVIIHVL